MNHAIDNTDQYETTMEYRRIKHLLQDMRIILQGSFAADTAHPNGFADQLNDYFYLCDQTQCSPHVTISKNRLGAHNESCDLIDQANQLDDYILALADSISARRARLQQS